MKKYIAYVLSVLVLCSLLSGCGRNNTENDKIINTPIIDMETDKNDGVVTDRDGIIEDNKNDNATTNNSGSNSQNGSSTITKTSPSPEVTNNP